MTHVSEIRLPPGCIVVLVGPSGAGKTTWAETQFAAGQVVSSDRLRLMTGASEADQRAGNDAFELLDVIVAARMKRRLTTVIDTLGFDDERRRGYVAAAHDAGMMCVAVVFDVEPAAIRRRNAASRWPLPQRVLASQRSRMRQVVAAIDEEGFDGVYAPGPVRVVPHAMLAAPDAQRRQEESPMKMKFGLQISNFTWDGGPADLSTTLAEIGRTAEEGGFSSLWVMDHFRQIPQVGPEWHDMLDSFTALGYLAAVTERVTLGPLVAGVGYRNPAHLGKIVATLDVLSGGRAVCGLGIGWFEKEAHAYGWEFPSVKDRFALLEDTLELLPLLWGPGAKEYRGRVLHVPEAMCYPRPLQERIPVLIGGSGERRTLRLVAEHADMCNLFGDADTVRHKLDVLRRHCTDAGRAFDDIEITHLSSAVTALDESALRTRLESWRGPSDSIEDVAAATGAGTIGDQIGRYRLLAEAGVQHAIIAIRDPSDLDAVRAFADVIAAFSHPAT